MSDFSGESTAAGQADLAGLYETMAAEYAAQALDEPSADAARMPLRFVTEQLIDPELGVVEAGGLEISKPFITAATGDEEVVRVLSIPTRGVTQYRGVRYLPNFAAELPGGVRLKPGEPGWEAHWNTVPITREGAQGLLGSLATRHTTS